MDRLQTGCWWKFSKYEVRDGIILPAAGAVCKCYDPWESFNQARAGEQDLRQGKSIAEPPYRQLFSLIKHTEGPVWAGGGVGLDVEAIVDWCSRFGLLGLVPHCAYAITVPARWAKIEETPATRIWRRFNHLAPERLVPLVSQHFRQPTGWESTTTPFPPATKVDGRKGMVVDAADLPGNIPKPGVLWTDLAEVKPSILALDSLLPYFVGSKLAGFECPMPLSSAFWEIYGEPVEHFFNAVLTLHNAVATIAKLGKCPRELQGDDPAHLIRATALLTALAAPVSISVAVSDDGSGLIQKWAGPSLLSSFAHMAVQDLTAGFVRVCSNCNGVFVTSAWQGTYCSGTCRNTALKRLLRERQKITVEMHRAGKSVEEIARAVGSTKSTVKGWLNK